MSSANENTAPSPVNVNVNVNETISKLSSIVDKFHKCVLYNLMCTLKFNIRISSAFRYSLSCYVHECINT